QRAAASAQPSRTQRFSLTREKNQKKAPHQAGPRNHDMPGSGFGRLHAGGLRTLRALRHLVADALAFLQAAETLGLDRREVHEDIRAAVLGCDETEALGVVEPFHCAVLHDSPSLVWMRCACNPLRSPGRTAASMQSKPGGCNHPVNIRVTSAGSPDDAASTFASTSCSVITSSIAGPAPAAQLATMARQAESRPSSRASPASGLPVMPTRSQPPRRMRALSARVSRRGPWVAP